MSVTDGDHLLPSTEAILNQLEQSLSVLNAELVPIHNRLVILRKQLLALASEPRPNKADLKRIVEELRKIDSCVPKGATATCTTDTACRKRVDGKFLGPGGVSVPEGQALLSGLLDECFEVVQDIKAREAEEDVSPPLKPIWERLTAMKQQLEQLSKWWLGGWRGWCGAL